jgi:hypothetical protein
VTTDRAVSVPVVVAAPGEANKSSSRCRFSELFERYCYLPLGFVDAAVLAVVERLK